MSLTSFHLVPILKRHPVSADFLQCESSAPCLCIVTDLIKATSVMLALLLTAGPSKLTIQISIDSSIPRSILSFFYQFRLSLARAERKSIYDPI